MKATKSLVSWVGLLAGILTGWPMGASAVHEKENGEWPWNLELHGWHDREVAEELGTGWFLNVGPTGIRARITHEHPEFLTVKYVFKKSPAAGVVKINDIIVGANGKRLTVPHTFGRGSRGRGGWEGPMLDMSKLIEDSQGKDGKLELIIWPGGAKAAEKTVVVQIPAVGRFSPTWPYNCPRSERLFEKLCEFLADDYKRAGKFESMTHTHSTAVLALMADGKGRYDSLVRRIMADYVDKRYDPTNGDGFPAWGQVHDGIVMGEYYLLTKDRKLLPAMRSLAECLDNCVWPESGGLSHRPFAAIQRRIAAGGPKGYGAMAFPAGLGMTALSLFKQAGLEHAEASYQRIHQAFLGSVSESGAIGYGFSTWDHAVIELEDPKGSPKSSPKGIGFECPDGMKSIGGYKIIWPGEDELRSRSTDWLDKEKETNRVFDAGGGRRLVVRTMAPEEPTSSYRHNGGPCDHQARSGVGALAHAIGNQGNASWGYLSDLMATGCAKSYKGLLDGHASTHMHVVWGSLGAALADPRDFREYLDYIKWWMIMAEAHDGGYVVMPGRDYASTDHVYGTRVFPAACAALIISVKDRRLQITGACKGTAAPAPAPAAATPGNPSGGKGVASGGEESPWARLLDDGRDKLEAVLLRSLAGLSSAGTLPKDPVPLSKARTGVRLVKADAAGTLTFQAVEGNRQAEFKIRDLTPADLSGLAKLAAGLMPDDLEMQAVAGTYLSLLDQPGEAEPYFQKAGLELTTQWEDLIE